MRLAAFYGRKSSKEDQGDDEAKSIVRQIANGQRFATTKNWTIADEHVFATIPSAAPTRIGWCNANGCLRPRRGVRGRSTSWSCAMPRAFLDAMAMKRSAN